MLKCIHELIMIIIAEVQTERSKNNSSLDLSQKHLQLCKKLITCNIQMIFSQLLTLELR